MNDRQSDQALVERQCDLFNDRTERQMKAPSVTEAEVQAAVHKIEFTVLQDGRTTIALITMDNGFTVRGESSCVSAENFDASIGAEIATKDAMRNVWMLLCFLLADRRKRSKRAPSFHCSITGEYVTAEFAAANPDTTFKRS